jgi:hypothetical protein
MLITRPPLILGLTTLFQLPCLCIVEWKEDLWMMNLKVEGNGCRLFLRLFQHLSERIVGKDEKPVRYLTAGSPEYEVEILMTLPWRPSGMWLRLLQIGAGLYLSVVRGECCNPGYNSTVIIHVKLLLHFFKQSILLSSSKLCGGSL